MVESSQGHILCAFCRAVRFVISASFLAFTCQTFCIPRSRWVRPRSLVDLPKTLAQSHTDTRTQKLNNPLSRRPSLTSITPRSRRRAKSDDIIECFQFDRKQVARELENIAAFRDSLCCWTLRSPFANENPRKERSNTVGRQGDKKLQQRRQRENSL